MSGKVTAAEAKRESLVAEQAMLENALGLNPSTGFLIARRLDAIEAEIDEIDAFLDGMQQRGEWTAEHTP